MAHPRPRLRFGSATSPKTRCSELKPLALHEDAGRMGFRCRPNTNPRLRFNTPSHTWMLASAQPKSQIHCEFLLWTAPSKVAHPRPRMRFGSATSPNTRCSELKPLALHEDAGWMGFRCRSNSNPRLGFNTPSLTWMRASALPESKIHCENMLLKAL